MSSALIGSITTEAAIKWTRDAAIERERAETTRERVRRQMNMSPPFGTMPRDYLQADFHSNMIHIPAPPTILERVKRWWGR